MEDDSISYLESTVHYSHILPAKEKGDDEDEERAEQPEEDAPMGDDFSPPGYLQVRRERQEFQFSGKVEQILKWLPCTG